MQEVISEVVDMEKNISEFTEFYKTFIRLKKANKHQEYTVVKDVGKENKKNGTDRKDK